MNGPDINGLLVQLPVHVVRDSSPDISPAGHSLLESTIFVVLCWIDFWSWVNQKVLPSTQNLNYRTNCGRSQRRCASTGFSWSDNHLWRLQKRIQTSDGENPQSVDSERYARSIASQPFTAARPKLPTVNKSGE